MRSQRRRGGDRTRRLGEEEAFSVDNHSVTSEDYHTLILYCNALLHLSRQLRAFTSSSQRNTNVIQESSCPVVAKCVYEMTRLIIACIALPMFPMIDSCP